MLPASMVENVKTEHATALEGGVALIVTHFAPLALKGNTVQAYPELSLYVPGTLPLFQMAVVFSINLPSLETTLLKALLFQTSTMKVSM